jgi:spermidine synthase
VKLRHAILLFLTSASVLSYEILLMRLLSVGLWYHFAYMVISLALLGFGAAGSFLFIGFERMEKRFDQSLLLLAGATAVAFPMAFALSQETGLDPLQLIWQKNEWGQMLISYLLMGLPFFLAGGIVGMILTAAGEKAHLMYGADLMGAGCGALAVIPALCFGPPWALLPVLGGVVLLGGLGCCRGMPHPWRGMSWILVCAALSMAVYEALPPIPKMHHTKPLPVTLAFPDARVEAEKNGPLGMLHVVGSSLIREAPGLSLNFGLQAEEAKVLFPEQKLLFLDGDVLGPITRLKENREDLEYLDFTSISLPYHIRQPSTALIIGSGGGTDVLLALRQGVSNITALEANQQIADLLSGPFREFSGDLYGRKGVDLKVQEAREFLYSSNKAFDLISLSLLDSFGSSAGGLHSASENYLYTTEAFRLYLSRLSDSGILAVSRWLKLPPRDSLRVFATSLAALKEMGVTARPEDHLLFITSWKTSTILVSKFPFTSQEFDRAIEFCERRSFDLAYYAGMKRDMANRFDILDQPHYYNGAMALSGAESDSFLRRYLFDLSPTTDDRPYFSHFFRWDKAVALFQMLKREGLPLIDMGYIFVIATLLQALIASGLLMIMPLFALKWLRRKGPGLKARNFFATFTYFGSIGLAFMFIELSLLPKFTLLLSHPIYSAATVLSSILCFAGLGSVSVSRFQNGGSRFLWGAVAIISAWVTSDAVAGGWIFSKAMAWPLAARMALTVSMISVLAFFLGWPFPSGLRMLAKRSPSIVPWAWGINGCASVTGAVIAKCLTVSIGFRLLMFAACGLYLLAALVFTLAFRDKDQG